jgi:hypothetical protein
LGKAAKAAQLSATVPQAPTGATGATGANGAVPFDAQGDLAGASTSPSTSQDRRKPHGPSLGATRDLLDTIIGRPGHVDDGNAPSTQYTAPGQEATP